MDGADVYDSYDGCDGHDGGWGDDPNDSFLQTFTLSVQRLSEEISQELAIDDGHHFLLTLSYGGAHSEVHRSYDAFCEIDQYLRSSIEFGGHVETLPLLPSAAESIAKPEKLENYLGDQPL